MPRGDTGASRGDTGASRGDTGASRGDTGASRGDTGASRGDTGASRGDTGASRGDRHVHEADVLRVLTFACVIAVHTIAHTTAPGDRFGNGVEVLLHFTREAFFCLTGFVLMHQYGRRKYQVRAFWRRRLLLVGGPYAVWTLIYTGWPHSFQHGAVRAWTHELVDNLIFGSACYHLYFLLVSLQIYLLFPLLSKVVRATSGHHGALLAASGAIQLALLAWLAYGPAWTGWAAHLAKHQDTLFWNYQFWAVLGAVAAFHLDQVRTWTESHLRAIGVAVAAAAAFALVWYRAALAAGSTPGAAAAVLQPVMAPWSLAAIAGLFAVGSIWRARRRPGLVQRAIALASDRSFGIFLVHPLLIGYVLSAGHRWLPRTLPNPLLTLACYLLVVAASALVTEVMRRSPASLMLTGRHQLRHRPLQGGGKTLKADNRNQSTKTEGHPDGHHTSLAGARDQATS